MSRFRFIFVLSAVVAALPTAAAQTQGGKDAARDPADPKAAVPPVRYESPFARYRPNAEVEVGAWRDANDTVRRIGGWRVYGREAIAGTQAEPPASPARAGAAAEPPAHGHAQRGPR